MQSIEIKGLDATVRALERSDQAVRTAAAITLTRAAQQSRQQLRGDIRSIFDNATPFIARSPYYRPASDRDRMPEARVGITDASFVQGRYGPADVLSAYISQGTLNSPAGDRDTKAMEGYLRGLGVLPNNRYLALGWDAPTDQYGNLKRQVLRAAFEAISQQADPLERRGRGGKRGLSKRGWRYFVVVRNGQPLGIFRSRGKQRGNAQSLLIFTRRPRYSQRLPFEETIQENYDRAFNTDFQRRLNREFNKIMRGA